MFIMCTYNLHLCSWQIVIVLVFSECPKSFDLCIIKCTQINQNCHYVYQWIESTSVFSDPDPIHYLIDLIIEN